MTDVSNSGEPKGPEKSKSAGRWLTLAIAAFVLIGAAAILIVMVPASFKPAATTDLKSLAKGGMKKLVITESGAPAPALPFDGPDGKKVSLADFKGQVVVLNFWATWCGPCVEEMPTLAKLKASYAVQPVKVLTVSVDRTEDQPDARAALAKLPPLEYYGSQLSELPFQLSPRVANLPTTIIFDKTGKERARLAGGADWSSPEAHALVETLLREK